MPYIVWHFSQTEYQIFKLQSQKMMRFHHQNVGCFTLLSHSVRPGGGMTSPVYRLFIDLICRTNLLSTHWLVCLSQSLKYIINESHFTSVQCFVIITCVWGVEANSGVTSILSHTGNTSPAHLQGTARYPPEKQDNCPSGHLAPGRNPQGNHLQTKKCRQPRRNYINFYKLEN